MEVVLLGAGATDVSEQFVPVPNPTKSTIWEPVGQVPVSAVVLLTKATLPAVPEILIDPVASGVGKTAPTAPPVAS